MSRSSASINVIWSPGEQLYGIYSKCGVYHHSDQRRDGGGRSAALRRRLPERQSAFTGNSGVGKSSILNALDPGLAIATGEVSEKLGRGRHTTRHVELFRLPNGALVADTPGFASFDTGRAGAARQGRTCAGLPGICALFGPVSFCRLLPYERKGLRGVGSAGERGDIPVPPPQLCAAFMQAAKEYKSWEH